MIKRVLYFGSDSYIHTRKEQLLVEFTDKEKQSASIPIEDIGVVILDAPQMTVSRAVMSKMLENNVAIIVCNEKHLPKGLMLNLESNSIQQEHFRNQINATEPLKKSLWQQTIKYKIKNQALLLQSLGITAEKLRFWFEKVKSGDPENVEGRAAAYYWQNIYSDIIEKFRRRRTGNEPNNLLNYGYAVLRATVAREIVGSGLLPTLGIHHHNRYNAYALADDIMEPYRPFVDWIVRDIVEKYYNDEWVDSGFNLSPPIKKELLKIPLIDVVIEGKTHPLSIAVRHTTASLAECFAKTKRKIAYPRFEPYSID
ncbi:MAG: type II CRISPR-associated endonuclease Cas1 [Bacteroidales bacterium]|nr:type II CRISPR-associated endonuclease Cas1 [Bacteroidales bacterium]